MSVGFRTTYCLFLICIVISELNVTLLGCYEPGGLILLHPAKRIIKQSKLVKQG